MLNKFLTGEFEEEDIDEGEREFDCELYVFESPKAKIKDSKYQKYLELKKEGKFPEFEVRIGGRVKKKDLIIDKKKSMHIGPSSDWFETKIDFTFLRKSIYEFIPIIM